MIMIIFGTMISGCLVCAIYFIISHNMVQKDKDYLEAENFNGIYKDLLYLIAGTEFIIIFLSWVLNLSNLVPISLLVTLEVVKMI